MLENGNLISLILNKSSHLEGMALTQQQQGSTRHRRVEFIFEVGGIYRRNLEAIFSWGFFFHFLSSLQKFASRVDVESAFAFFFCSFLFIYIIVRLIDLIQFIHPFPHPV